MGLYVITGGSGFLGQALAARLRAASHSVILASRVKPHTVGHDWIEFDLKNHETVNNIVTARPDGVFHLAWSTTPATAELSPASDISTNLAGTINLLDQMSKVDGDVKIVLASSGGAVYGHTGNYAIPESHQLNPIGVYGMTKYSMELYASRCQLFSGLDVRIARISNPFGIGQTPTKMQGAATIFARRIVRGETIHIWGDGSIIRDYIDVGDVASGLIAVMHVDRGKYAGPLAFNVGSGHGLSLIDLIEHLEIAADRRAIVTFNPQRDFDVPVNYLDVSSLKNNTGWEPGDIREKLTLLVNELKKS
jgi:UDP-glucose 4-epimerase